MPTCGLQEGIGEVRRRVSAAGWEACVVVNDERVVLGLLRAGELAKGTDEPVEQTSGDGTVRRGATGEPETCTRCGGAIGGCALCQREECRDLLCYRCVRILLASRWPNLTATVGEASGGGLRRTRPSGCVPAPRPRRQTTGQFSTSWLRTIG